MSEWIELRLGEVCSRLSSGTNITAKDIHDAGSFPVFGGNGIRGYAAEANFSGECAIIGRQGAYCGNVRYFIGEARMSEHAIVACAGPNHHTRFLAYLLSNMNLGSLSGQAAQPGLSVKVLAQQSVRMPSRQYQGRIAEILGAYDDLIEVNRRRIAVLEEMARGLFDEWFVRFRFPGHESASLVETPDGPLPQGWSFAPLEQFLVLQRGFDLPKSKRGEGAVPVFSASGFHGGHSEAKVTAPGVVTGRSGTIGQVHLIMEDYWPLNTTLYVREFRRAGPAYALLLLRRLDLAQHASGAAVPTLNRNHIHGIKLPAAPQPLMERFEKFAFANFQSVRSIEQANERLAASRDLLLPRLISGQLSVEAAERDLELAA